MYCNYCEKMLVQGESSTVINSLVFFVFLSSQCQLWPRSLFRTSQLMVTTMTRCWTQLLRVSSQWSASANTIMVQRRQYGLSNPKRTPPGESSNNRPPPHSCWLAVAGRPRKAAAVPQANNNINSSSRHEHYLWPFKTSDHSELTVPWEERIEEANVGKYQELVKAKKIFFEPIEVGCRGFAVHSLSKVLSLVGVIGVSH